MVAPLRAEKIPKRSSETPGDKKHGTYTLIRGFGGNIGKKEDDRSTYAPKRGEPKDVFHRKLIESTKNDVENDDLPTLGPGSKRRPTPAEMSCEEKALDPLSDTSKETNSFAPPKIPDIGEISKFKEKGTTHTIVASFKKTERNLPKPVKRNLLTGENVI